MKEERVLSLEIVKANDEDGISINIDIPRRSEKSSDNLIKLISPKENDKFIVFSGYNLFRIDLNEYFKKESSLEEILEGIDKIEDDIATVTNVGIDKILEMLDEDEIEIRLVSEKLVEEDIDRDNIKNYLFDIYEYGEIEIAINCFGDGDLAEFLTDCVILDKIKITKMLDVLLYCSCNNKNECISKLFEYVAYFDFKKLKSICEKN